jgi:uncharacterized protein
MARARKFYETVLGVSLVPLQSPDPNLEMLTFPMHQNAAGAGGALAKMQGGPTPGGGIIVYFQCEDCAVEAGRVAGAGGTLKQDKFSIGPYGYIALAQDTEGNTIGLHSMK